MNDMFNARDPTWCGTGVFKGISNFMSFSSDRANKSPLFTVENINLSDEFPAIH